MTKKLKAKWSPELGQDLNAYHNLDAEVELTQILSEQIALEIDREILNDLIQGATAGTYYWSRSPGLFVTALLALSLVLLQLLRTSPVRLASGMRLLSRPLMTCRLRSTERLSAVELTSW
jgi:hypothetical protein